MKICNRQLRLFNKNKCSKYRCCNYITIFKENKETMRCFAKYIMCLSVACYILLWMIATIILLAKTPPLTIRNKCPRSMLFTNSIFQILVTLIIAADQLYYYKYAHFQLIVNVLIYVIFLCVIAWTYNELYLECALVKLHNMPLYKISYAWYVSAIVLFCCKIIFNIFKNHLLCFANVSGQVSPNSQMIHEDMLSSTPSLIQRHLPIFSGPKQLLQSELSLTNSVKEHDTMHNTMHNDTMHNDTMHNDTMHNTMHNDTINKTNANPIYTITHETPYGLSTSEYADL